MRWKRIAASMGCTFTLWVGLALLAHPARAEDEAQVLASRLEALAESIKAHKAAKDYPGLKGDIDDAVVLHKDAADVDACLQPKVISLIANIGRLMRNEGTLTALLKGLGRTGDLGAAKRVRPYLRQGNAKKAGPVLMTAIAVAGQLPHDDLVGPLLKIFTRSKHMGAASKAVESLGAFHDSKRMRLKILKTLIDETRSFKPGVKGSEKGYVPGEVAWTAGDDTRNRWATFSRVLPKTLSTLTGRDNSGMSAEDWFDLHDENKKSLRSLFVD